MNILYKMVDPDNILGFNYILENKDYYIDISCEDYEDSDLIYALYVTEKKDLNKLGLEERDMTLHRDYEIVIITEDKITLKQNQSVKQYFKGVK
tara:strand:+ start:913 stop:1194 length:282 start_codon:yes stop_codon:yes gene_type:complete